MKHSDAQNETEPGNSCDGQDCFLPTSRRQFLRDSFLSAAAALVAVGASRATAMAMPLELTEPTHGSGNTRSYTLPTGDGAQIDKDNFVIIVRWQGAIYAFSLACPHQNTSLKWDDQAKEFQCPKHHSAFKPDGEYVPGSGRATRNMDRFAITMAGNSVTVDFDKLYQDDEDSAQWSAAVGHVTK